MNPWRATYPFCRPPAKPGFSRRGDAGTAARVSVSGPPPCVYCGRYPFGISSASLPLCRRPARLTVPLSLLRRHAGRAFVGRAVFRDRRRCCGALIVSSAAALWRRDPAVLFWTTLGYFAYELGLNVLLVTAAWLGLRARRVAGGERKAGAARPAGVVRADRRAQRARTASSTRWTSVFRAGGRGLAGHRRQRRLDRRHERRSHRALRPAGGKTAMRVASPGAGEPTASWLLLLALPKLGKGGVLNAALAEATRSRSRPRSTRTRGSRPARWRRWRTRSARRKSTAAGGFVYVRNAGDGSVAGALPILGIRQEFHVAHRPGAPTACACRCRGAFGAFRTRTCCARWAVSAGRAWWKITSHLPHARAAAARGPGQPYRVEVVPDAVAYTDSPDTVPTFVHQRTRWFAGFLQTLWEYRRMVGDPRMGALGWLMLPIKCVDAILPLWGFTLAGNPVGGDRFGGFGALAARRRWSFCLRCAGGRSRPERDDVDVAPAAVSRTARHGHCRRLSAGLAHGQRGARLQLVPADRGAQRVQLVRAPKSPEVASTEVGQTVTPPTESVRRLRRFSE